MTPLSRARNVVHPDLGMEGPNIGNLMHQFCIGEYQRQFPNSRTPTNNSSESINIFGPVDILALVDVGSSKTGSQPAGAITNLLTF
jgi:hypothetical protein